MNASAHAKFMLYKRMLYAPALHRVAQPTRIALMCDAVCQQWHL